MAEAERSSYSGAIKEAFCMVSAQLVFLKGLLGRLLVGGEGKDIDTHAGSDNSSVVELVRSINSVANGGIELFPMGKPAGSSIEYVAINGEYRGYH